MVLWTVPGTVWTDLCAVMTMTGRTSRFRARFVASMSVLKLKVRMKSFRVSSLQMTDGMLVRPPTPTLTSLAN